MNSYFFWIETGHTTAGVAPIMVLDSASDAEQPPLQEGLLFALGPTQ